MSAFPATKTTRKPLRKYNPGILDEENLETLKMCVSEELWDISKNFLQTDEILNGAYEKVDRVVIDIEDARGMIETVWKLSVSADEVLASRVDKLEASIDGEDGNLGALIKEERIARVTADEALAQQILTLRADVDTGITHLSSQITETNRVVTDLEKTIAQNITELESSITSSNTSAKDALEQAQKDLEDAIARGDFEAAEALRKEIERLQGLIDAATREFESKIKITNETIATLEMTMAKNVTELESSITNGSSSAKDALEKAQKDLEEAIANGDLEAAEALRKEIERLQGIIENGLDVVKSQIKITNETVATLTETVATNKTELESKINGIVDGTLDSFVDEAVAKAREELEIAQKALEEAIARGDKDAADALKAEIDRLMGIIDSATKDFESKLSITNQTVATLEKTMATNITALESSISMGSTASKDALEKAQKDLEEAIANGDLEAAEELRKEIERLQGVIADGLDVVKSQIKITNETVATLTETVATNKTELESKINGIVDGTLDSFVDEAVSQARKELEVVKKALEDAIARGDYEAALALGAEVERLLGIINTTAKDFESKLSITNQTIATLEKTVATNKTELESSITTSSNSAASSAVAQAKRDLDAAKAALDKAISDGDKVAAAELLKEVERLTGLIETSKEEAQQAIDQAKKDLDAAKLALEEAIRNGDKDAIAELMKEIERLLNIINTNKTDIESKLKITNETMATLTETVAKNETTLSSRIDGVVSNTSNALTQAEKDLAAAKKALEASIANGDKASSDALIAEINRLLGIIDDNKSESNSEIAQAKRDLEAAKKALETAIANGDNAGAAALLEEIRKLLITINGNKADIESKLTVTNQTLATLDSTVASQITNLTSNFNGQMSSVNQTLNTHSDKLGNMSASWGVTVDANGVIGGVQLVTDSKTKYSEFKVNADKMIFTNGSQSIKPITIENGKATFNDVVVRGTFYANSFKGVGSVSSIAGGSYGGNQSGTTEIDIGTGTVNNISEETVLCITEVFNIELYGHCEVAIRARNRSTGSYNTRRLKAIQANNNCVPVSCAVAVDVSPESTQSIQITVQKTGGTGYWSAPEGHVIRGLHRKYS